MYSSSGGDARPTAASNARDSSSSMPPDHPSTWDRQVFSREKFDRADRDRHTQGKKEWSSDRSQSSHRSSGVLPVNGNLLGPPSKRRAVGRHGALAENGRYGSAASRPTDSSGLRGTASPVENGKAERDACSLSGGAIVLSPGYCGSPGTERPNKDQDVHHFREPCLSPGDGRLASSPTLDQASRPSGGQSAIEVGGSWDRERSKFSSHFGWDPPHRERDFRERGVKTEIHRRTGSFAKLDSGRDWSLGDRELEGRLDRYGSGSNREHAFPDVLSGSKEHARHDWRGRDRALLSTLSSRSSACASGNGYRKDTSALSLAVPEVSGTTTSPQHSPLLTSASVEPGRDDGGLVSPRKRPRLGWGQGLAKYEKEKVEEDPVVAKNSDEGINCGHGFGSSVDVLGGGDQSTISLQNGSVLGASSGQGCLSADRPHNTNTFKSSLESGCVELSPTTVQELIICAGLDTPTTVKKAEDQDDISRNSESGAETSPSKHSEHVGSSLASTTNQSQPSMLHDADALPATFWENASNLPKESLLQQVEKVEYEIDLVEKELVKLENESDIADLSVEEGATSIMEAHDQTVLLLNSALKVAAEAELPSIQHDKAPSPACVVPLSAEEDQSTENAPLLHDSSSKENLSEVVEVIGQLEVHDVAEDRILQDELRGVKSDCEERADKVSDIECPTVNACETLNCTTDLGPSNMEEQGKLFSLLILQNQELAKHSFEPLSHLLPKCCPSRIGKMYEGGKLYSCPQEADTWQQNMESHERNRKYLEGKVAEEKYLLRFKEKVLAVKYRALRESWKQEQIGNGQRKDRAKPLRRWESERRNGSIPPSQRSSLRLRPVACSTRPDAVVEEVQVVRKLLSEPPVDYQRAYLRMPTMLLDDKERAFHRFPTNNGLVEDPVGLEQERKAVNPWSVDEKKIFMDKYTIFGKNFSQIASFLEHKTAADCVEFYYRNQKSEDFEKVRRRQQLKKRRDYSRTSGSYLATTTSVSNRHREANAARVESLVAAAAAAMSMPRDFAKVVRSSSHKMVERARHVSADSGSSDTPSAKTVSGKEKSTANNLSALASFSSAVASPCPISNASLKIHRDKNLVKQGSNPTVPVVKGSNGEQQLGVKGARSMHARSVKGSSEDADSQWTDNERELFTGAVAMFGKDFQSISLHIGSKSQGQCKAFFSKTRKRLGLDQLVERFKETLQAGIDSGLDDMKQTGSPEDLKPLLNSDEVTGTGLTDVYPKPLAVTDMEDVRVGRLEQQGRIEENQPVEESQVNEAVNETRSVGTPQEENDLEHDDVISALKSLHTGTEARPVDDVILKTNDACRPMADALLPAQKEEAQSSIDDRDKPSGVLNQSLDLAPADTGGSSAQSTSLACAETLQFKAEQVRVKMEPVTASNSVRDLVHTAPLVPFSVTSAAVPVPCTYTAAPVAHNVQVKDKGPKVMEAKTRREPTSWTQDEKEKFVDIFRKHGKDWALLQESLPAKSLTQIKTYFQNSKAKLGFAPEGTGSGSGRGGLARKRKADDSDSSSNAGSGGQMVQQKVPLHSDEGSLKVSASVLGPSVGMSAALGNNMVGAEALAYAALFGRNSAQVLEDPVSAQKVFHPMALPQNSNATGILPMFNPATLSVFAPAGLRPNNLGVQQSFVHSTSLKTQQLVNHQQPQQSLAPLVVQPLQQQAPPVGIHQQSQVVHQLQQQQQQQAVPRNHQDLQNPVVQHLHKQAAQQQQQQNPQVLLQQQQQQVVQHLQQQVTEAVLQQHLQPQLLQRQQQQQLAAQVPHHLQQVINHHQAQSQQQPSSQGMSPQQQVTGQQHALANQVVSQQQASTNHHQQAGSQQKVTTQQQQQSGQFQSQLFQLHSKQQALLQQQQVPHQQQQLQQLQLHLQQQQLQLQRQQPQTHPQQQIQVQQLQKQISGISQSQQQSFLLLHEQQQQQQQQQLQHGQQLVLLRGVAQTSGTGSEVQKQSDSELRSKFQQLACEDLQQPQGVSQVAVQAQSKVHSASEAQVRAGDVKLFGQSLLLQPSSSSQQTSCKSSSTSTSSQVALSAVSTSISTAKSSPDTLPKSYGAVGGPFMQGQGWQVLWPSASVGNTSSSSSVGSILQTSTVARSLDGEPELHSVQEAVARMTERLSRVRDLEHGHVGDLTALSDLTRVQDGRSHPNAGHSPEHCVLADPTSGSSLPSGEVKRLDNDNKRCDQVGGPDRGILLNRSRGPDFNPLSVGMPGGQVPASQGLPRVLDALVALAEWRMQNTSSSSGRLTEELLNQPWEALRRDPGSAVEAGKGSASLGLATSVGQTYAGGPEILQHVRDSLFYAQPHLMHLQGHAGGGGAWGSSGLLHLNDAQHILVQPASSFRSHGSSHNPSSSDEQARVESRDPDVSGGAVG